MKNNNFKNKAQKQPKKKKNSLSFYIVLGLMIFCLVGSILGSVAFVRSFADEDTKYPIVTNYVPTHLEDGSDIGDTWVYFPKYTETIYIEEYDEYRTFIRYYDINFQLGEFYIYTNDTDLYFDFDGVLVNQVFPSEFVKDTKDYTLVYFDNDYLSNFYVIYEEDVRDTYTSVVSNLFDSVPIVYYVPFNNGVGVLGSITSILTGGIFGLGQGVGSGLSTLTSSVFINNGSLSTFGIFVVVFSAIAFAIGLCRLVVYWLGSLGGKKV